MKMVAQQKRTRPELFDAALRQHFHMFVRKVFETVQPGRTFIANWHIDAICHAAMSFLESDDVDLVVNVPPRSMKSIILSVALPAYLLGRDPSRQIICISFASSLADQHARDTRLVMEQGWYRRIFPRTKIERNPSEGIFTTAKGYRRVTTITGTITGLGGDIFIVDDPIKPEDAFSDAVRESTNGWFGSTLSSRANDKRTVKTILVMQRIHMEDPSALLLGRSRTRHLFLPAVADSDQDIDLPIGLIKQWKAGELLDAVRLPQDVLDRFKHEIGERNFSAQYLQAPVLVDGDTIRWSWFQTYEVPPSMVYGDLIIQSWDTAMTDTVTADYSVCTIWLVRDDNFYLLDVLREKLQFPDLLRRVASQKARCPNATVLVEDKGSGTSIAQVLKRELKGVIPFKVTGEKNERAALASIKIERGEVFIPKKAAWLSDFKSECLAFPNGRHDDQIDSMSQAINWYAGRPAPQRSLFGSY